MVADSLPKSKVKFLKKKIEFHLHMVADSSVQLIVRYIYTFRRAVKSKPGEAAMTTRQAAAVGKMKCISCLENYDARDAGTCKECYEEANETEEELKREIDDLKSKVAFLKFSTRSLHPTPFSDVVLLASDDPSTAVPVPAHKAVLVSIPTSLFSFSTPLCSMSKIIMLFVWNLHSRTQFRFP